LAGEFDLVIFQVELRVCFWILFCYLFRCVLRSLLCGLMVSFFVFFPQSIMVNRKLTIVSDVVLVFVLLSRRFVLWFAFPCEKVFY